MRERTYLFPIFLLCLGFTGILLLFAHFGWLFFLENSLQTVTFPLSAFIHTQTVATKTQSPLQKLQSENLALEEKVSAMARLEADNKALQDQFQTATPHAMQLLPATVVGMPGAIPNLSFPETMIVNKGSKDGITKGMAIVVKDQLLAIVVKVSDHFSQGLLVTAKSSALPVRDVTTGAIGIARGQGNGELLVDNVVLSDTLQIGDSIASLGSQDVSGKGVAPGLILGKIISIDKKASNLFQSAQVVPLAQLDRLSTVFILMQ